VIQARHLFRLVSLFQRAGVFATTALTLATAQLPRVNDLNLC
jgi:hypothetical protein